MSKQERDIKVGAPYEPLKRSGNVTQKTKIVLFGFILLVLVLVEFLLGFIVAIAEHWSDATTAIQTKFNAAIRATDQKGDANK